VTSLAVVPSPTETALTQLHVLRQRLDEPSLDFHDAVDVAVQAETIRSYAKTARLGQDLANEATETRLRAERRCGAILIDVIAQAGPSTMRAARRKTRPDLPEGTRMSLPPHTLAQFGISTKDSSRYQLLASMPVAEFDARLAALKAAGKQIVVLSFLRAASAYRRKPGGGRRATPAGTLLRRALELLREVRVINTPRELELARQVVKLGQGWAVVVEPKAPSGPTAVQRETTCLMCGRPRPASKPERCPSCGGAWYAS
jgi:hypothetical protein